MIESESKRPLQPGELAPDFALPLVGEEGQVSLARYRGRAPLFLVISRGLWCSFCRRYIAQLSGARDGLQRIGVDTLAVVASDLERARLYVRHRPMKMALAADPELTTHRAYGLTNPPLKAEVQESLNTKRVDIEKIAVTADDLAELRAAAATIAVAADDSAGGQQQLPLFGDFVRMQQRLYPYELAEGEQREKDRHHTLGTGQFLIDRDGIVRWANVQGVSGLERVANQAEILAAARTVAG